MSAMLGVNSDTYQNGEYEIKCQIGARLISYQNAEVINNIRKYLTESKLDIEAFELIGDFRSQICLIEDEVNSLHNLLIINNQPTPPLNSLSFHAKEKLIFLIDCFAISMEHKKNYFSNALNNIAKTTREMKYLDWFEDDVGKIASADDYFRKQNPYLSGGFNDAEDVRIYFYKNKTKKDYLELSFQKIRSLYNNRKSRENKNVKQCNFSLSIAADKNIDKLAKEHRMTRSEVVDIFFKNMKNIDFIDRAKIGTDISSRPLDQPKAVENTSLI